MGDQRLEYIEVALEDIAAANRLMHDLLGQAPSELPPQTRKLLALIRVYVSERSKREQRIPQAIQFTRSELRGETTWGDTQLKVHLARLVDMEYLHVTRNSHTRRNVYQLTTGALPDPEQRRLEGLVDIEALKRS
ncbi:MAG: hypothetical protein D6790_04510 [Caldilineae bacterium]|nr:MAG: hypothetical protein D6790_04510 [Caldilineae bacterium]